MEGKMWNYTDEPDPSRNGQTMPWMAGRSWAGKLRQRDGLGTRERADFDEWAALGCEGWDYESVLPFFKKAERYKGGADRYRGGDGPQRVTEQGVSHELNDAFIEAAGKAGYAENPDYNGESQDGVGMCQVAQRRGFRQSEASAYSDVARFRRNLTVRTKCFVRRIVFEGTRAVGVEYERNGKQVIERAAREVIASAGTMSSPKLLMVSGSRAASTPRGTRGGRRGRRARRWEEPAGTPDVPDDLQRQRAHHQHGGHVEGLRQARVRVRRARHRSGVRRRMSCSALHQGGWRRKATDRRGRLRSTGNGGFRRRRHHQGSARIGRAPRRGEHAAHGSPDVHGDRADGAPAFAWADRAAIRQPGGPTGDPHMLLGFDDDVRELVAAVAPSAKSSRPRRSRASSSARPCRVRRSRPTRSGTDSCVRLPGGRSTRSARAGWGWTKKRSSIRSSEFAGFRASEWWTLP